MAGVKRRYLLASDFVYPAGVAWTVWRALRDRNARYLRERLSGTVRAPAVAPIWLHCASVGELNTATPLIRATLARSPDAHFVVTTNTPTAAEVFRTKRFPAAVAHRFLPLDYSRHCRKFLGALKPCAAWIMETELWLNLFAACHRRGVPISIVNARLSEKTLRAAQGAPMRGYYRACAGLASRILARSEEDARRFADIGAPPERIRVAGNLKYAAEMRGDHPRLVRRPYFLASSTHAGEEALVAGAFLDSACEGRLLVIVPRHPERGESVVARLRQTCARKGLNIARRGAGEDADTATIYIADTVGELPAWIAHADFVVTGGTLTPVGGHNVLEPAALGTPQAVGPHAGNHAAEIAALRAADAIVEVADGEALAAVFKRAADGAYQPHAERAKQFMRDRKEVVRVYLDALLEGTG